VSLLRELHLRSLTEKLRIVPYEGESTAQIGDDGRILWWQLASVSINLHELVDQVPSIGSKGVFDDCMDQNPCTKDG
jgi:hypothetical protein